MNIFSTFTFFNLFNIPYKSSYKKNILNMKKKAPEIMKEEYLNKDFDYLSLTRDQLISILNENGLKPISVLKKKLKGELQTLYKANIHDKIDELKEKRVKQKKGTASKADLDKNVSGIIESSGTRDRTIDGSGIRDSSRLLSESKEASSSRVGRSKKESGSTNSANEDSFSSRSKKTLYSQNSSSGSKKKMSIYSDTSSTGYDSESSEHEEELRKGMKIKFSVGESNYDNFSNVSINSLKEGESGYNRLKKISIPNKIEDAPKIDKEHTKDNARISDKAYTQDRSISEHTQDRSNSEHTQDRFNSDYAQDRSNSDYTRDKLCASDTADFNAKIDKRSYINKLLGNFKTKRDKTSNSTFILKHNDKKYSSTSFREDSIVTTPQKRVKHSSLPIIKQNESTFVKHRTKKRKYKKTILFLCVFLFLFLFIFLKYFCPYCSENEFLCVKLPEKAKIENNEIICEKGFLFKKRMIFNNFCEIDKRNEKRKNLCLRKMIEFLILKNTKMIYGFERSNKISKKTFFKMFLEMFYNQYSDRNRVTNVFDTTSVDKLLALNDLDSKYLDSFFDKIQKDYKDIIIDETHVFSNKKVFNLEIIAKYYIYLLFLYFLLPFLLLLCIFYTNKFYRSRKIRIQEFEKMKCKIINEIKDALIGQKVNSMRNNDARVYVKLNQLKDYFCCEKKLWNEICNCVRNNANIKEYVICENEIHYIVWEWIGLIINNDPV